MGIASAVVRCMCGCGFGSLLKQRSYDGCPKYLAAPRSVRTRTYEIGKTVGRFKVRGDI